MKIKLQNLLKKTIFFIFPTLLLFVYMDMHLMAIEHIPPAIPYDSTVDKIERSDKAWAKILTPAQYKILRKKGTERSGTGQYDKFNEEGTYICAGCGNPIFSSSAKYDSKTGWPSFWEPLNDKSVATEPDRSLFFIVRTEVHCQRCRGHLGHIFNDGPKPSGLRYCINSVALSFLKKT